jgi:hypothetical protein
MSQRVKKKVARTAQKLADGMGITVAIDKIKGKTCTAGGSEKDKSKKVRKSNLEKLGPVIKNWPDRTKTWVQLAEMFNWDIAERYKQGQDFWTREGKLWDKEGRQSIVDAKYKNGHMVIPRDLLPKLITNHTGKETQAKLRKEVVNAKGQPRQRKPKNIKDQKDPSTGQFKLRDPDQAKFSGNAYYGALQGDIEDQEHLIEALKWEGHKMRDVSKRVYKAAHENTFVRKQHAEGMEEARKALLREDMAQKDKAALALLAAEKELRVEALERKLAIAVGWKRDPSEQRATSNSRYPNASG